jgi:hypothetical protein
LFLFWYLATHAFKKFSEKFLKIFRDILNLFVGPSHVFSVILLNIGPQTYTIRHKFSIKCIHVFSLKWKKGLPHCKKKIYTKIGFAFNSNFTYFMYWRQSQEYSYSLMPELRILLLFTNVRVRNIRH